LGLERYGSIDKKEKEGIGYLKKTAAKFLLVVGLK
jgi:hypothetical protein